MSQIKVIFQISGREYKDKNAKIKYYNTLNCHQIIPIQDVIINNKPQTVAEMEGGRIDESENRNEQIDDLPF